MTMYNHSVPYVTNNDIDHINDIRSWMIQNVKPKKWHTWTTQRSRTYEFVFHSKKDYVTFLLKWA